VKNYQTINQFASVIVKIRIGLQYFTCFEVSLFDVFGE